MNVLIPIFSPPTGTWGSLTRVMALAKKFIAEGHIVAFCSSGFVKDTLVDKGFKTYDIPETTILGLPKYLSNIFTKRSQKMIPPAKEGQSFGNIWLLYTFMGYGKKKVLHKIVEAEIKAAKDFNPDIILTEMEMGAYLSSYILKKPIITTYAKIALKGEDTFFYKKITKTIKSVLKKYDIEQKLKPEEIAFGARVLKLIPSIPDLDTTDPSRKDVCYTGNLLEPIKVTNKKFTPEKGKRYIFCYFGTGSILFETVVNVLPKVVNNFENTICYVASPFIKVEFNIGNVYFVKYIQATDLLKYCNLTICHGGLNTITQSLEAGVPLLVFPGPIFERRFNAERVEATGGGFWGELSNFNIKWLTEKMQKMENLNIIKLQEKFLEYKGVETAYNRITDWVKQQ